MLRPLTVKIRSLISCSLNGKQGLQSYSKINTFQKSILPVVILVMDNVPADLSSLENDLLEEWKSSLRSRSFPFFHQNSITPAYWSAGHFVLFKSFFSCSVIIWSSWRNKHLPSQNFGKIIFKMGIPLWSLIKPRIWGSPRNSYFCFVKAIGWLCSWIRLWGVYSWTATTSCWWNCVLGEDWDWSEWGWNLRAGGGTWLGTDGSTLWATAARGYGGYLVWEGEK